MAGQMAGQLAPRMAGKLAPRVAGQLILCARKQKTLRPTLRVTRRLHLHPMGAPPARKIKGQLHSVSPRTASITDETEQSSGAISALFPIGCLLGLGPAAPGLTG